MNQLYCVLVTCPSPDEAKRIGRLAVENRLAACAQITEAMTSIYTWDDTLQEEVESLLRLKTVEKRLAELELLIQREHSYDCPQIVGFKLSFSSARYQKWVEKNSSITT
jgi:periplasmic divalent cation tolerance protein